MHTHSGGAWKRYGQTLNSRKHLSSISLRALFVGLRSFLLLQSHHHHIDEIKKNILIHTYITINRLNTTDLLLIEIIYQSRLSYSVQHIDCLPDGGLM